VSSFQPLTEMSDEDVDWIYGVNLMGVVSTVRAFLPDMLEAGEGHVLATASIAGLVPGLIPRHAAYSSAKLGVIGLMMNLRHELAERGVGATVYCPSFVASEMGRNQVRARPDRFGPGGEIDVPADVRATLVAAGLVPREPEAVAPEVLDAVRHNRPIAFNTSDTPDRRRFLETYVEPVLAAFDAVEAEGRSRT
jgi:NAD(P)-dependent dehydrogenase (short-subunit alcohol dehydrogenase family)